MPTKAPKRGAPAPSALRKSSGGPTFAAASALTKRRSQIVKAQVFRPMSGQAAPPDEADPTWEGIGALVPPYDPFVLLTLVEHSNSLRQCIDSYVTNIDAFGHRFEPAIDLNAPDADKLVSQYIIARRAAKDPATVADPNRQIPAPDEEMIRAAKEELSEKMAAEGLRLQHFFDHACLDISFVTLRRRMRQDLETQGNAYWECIRSEDGKLAGFSYVPAFTVRHMAVDKVPVPVTYKVKENHFDYGTVETHKHFRRFVQVFESRVIWFKEFGDPRVVSRKTGQVFKSIEDMRREEKHTAAAQEILHFRVHTSKSSYGIPRWVGTLLSVLGSRQAEEVNLDYFENKSVPPLAILVSGGRISQKTVDRVQDFIENEVKGKRNYHKILLLEAENGAAGGGGLTGQGSPAKITMQPLTAAQHNDALFQNYDERNIDKVGMSFRLPRMLRGDIRDFNRATAEAALDFAESQVFRPERDEFDFTINRMILPALGIRFWRFVSNTATTQNVKDLNDMILGALEKGAATPAEARDLLEKVFNRPFRKIDAPWTKQPFPLTIAGIVPPDDLMAPGMVTPQVAATGAAASTPGTPGVTMSPAQPGRSMTAPQLGEGGSVKLTGTDAASVVTVNEARQDMGKGPLQMRQPDGTSIDDPDGWLTVAEFKAKRMAVGQTQGAAEGQNAAQNNVSPEAGLNQKSFNAMISNLMMMRKAIELLDRHEFATAHANSAHLGPNGES